MRTPRVGGRVGAAARVHVLVGVQHRRGHEEDLLLVALGVHARVSGHVRPPRRRADGLAEALPAPPVALVGRAGARGVAVLQRLTQPPGHSLAARAALGHDRQARRLPPRRRRRRRVGSEEERRPATRRPVAPDRVRSARAEGYNGVSASPQDVEPARVTGTRRCRRLCVHDHLVTGREHRARGGGQGCTAAHAPRLIAERARLE